MNVRHSSRTHFDQITRLLRPVWSWFVNLFRAPPTQRLFWNNHKYVRKETNSFAKPL